MILAITLSLIFEALLLMTSFLTYQKGMKKKFDILSEFPYELMDKKSDLAIVTRLTFLMSFVTLVPWLFFQLEAVAISATLSTMTWFVFAFFALFIALFVAISLTDPAVEKGHNFLFAGACAFLTISSGTEGTYLIRISSSAGNGVMSSLLILMGILCFLIALASLAILVNPKLKNWPKLEAVSETDGTVTFKRPRPFVLAFSEWILLFLAIAFSVIGSASLLISSLA